MDRSPKPPFLVDMATASAAAAVAQRLAVYDEQLDALLAKTDGEDLPPVVYHYTSWEAFESILTTQRFRATTHRTTRDRGELAAVDSMARAVARRLAKTPHMAAPLLNAFDREYDKNRAGTKLGDVFLICFSSARDKAHLWREYGDGGRGVCMGLHRLHEGPPPDKLLSRTFVRVEYDGQKVEATLAKGFQEICAAYLHEIGLFPSSRDPFAKNGDPFAQKAVQAMNRLAAMAAIRGKTEDWRDEEECRYIGIPRVGMAVPTDRGTWEDGTVHEYRDLTVRMGDRPLSFDEVIVGPRQDHAHATARVADLLGLRGYPHEFAPMPRITSSTVTDSEDLTRRGPSRR